MTDGPLTLQSFYKYDIASGLQEATIPSPFVGSGTFCAAAWAPSLMSSQAVSGTLTLGDTAFSGASTRSISYSVIQGTATVGSGSILCSAPSTALAINLPASATGAADLVIDGSSFLKRKVNLTLTGSNLAVGTITMQNGDVDGTGEVDAADIDQVIAAFGNMGNNVEDVDVSDEVDAADIDIVIANFGGMDD